MTYHDKFDPELHEDEQYNRCPLCNAAIAAVIIFVFGLAAYGFTHLVGGLGQ